VLTLTGEGGEPPSTELVNDVIAEISRTKPVRSHFTFTQGTQSTGRVGIATGARPAVYRRLQLKAMEP
jgi:P2-related tail formation protein